MKEGTIWEALNRPGRMEKVVKILPDMVYYENLQSRATFCRPRDNFLTMYEYRRETEQEKTMINNVADKWQELKLLVESLEEDVQKNASGNKAAGTRARKGLRTLKSTASELVRLTLGKE